jgi:hypothetical protein
VQTPPSSSGASSPASRGGDRHFCEVGPKRVDELQLPMRFFAMSILRVTAAVLTCILLVAPYGLPQGRDSRDEVPAKPSQRVRLTAEVEPRSAKPGQPVLLRLVLRNVSPTPVRVNDNGPETDLRTDDCSC